MALGNTNIETCLMAGIVVDIFTDRLISRSVGRLVVFLFQFIIWRKSWHKYKKSPAQTTIEKYFPSFFSRLLRSLYRCILKIYYIQSLKSVKGLYFIRIFGAEINVFFSPVSKIILVICPVEVEQSGAVVSLDLTFDTVLLIPPRVTGVEYRIH